MTESPSKVLGALIFIVLMLTVDPARANGATLYAVCATCHGLDGAGSLPLDAPRIAGLDAWYIKEQLTKFRSGQRGAHPDDVFGQQMALFAKALADDAAVESVAQYVAEFRADLPAASVRGDAARGQKLYQSCIACHGADANGMSALHTPNLTELDDWYVVRQLNKFRNGSRGDVPGDAFGQQMRGAAALLADEQAVRDVAAYILTTAR